MKRHGYYSRVMLAFIFNSAGKGRWSVGVEGRGELGRGMDFKACFQNGIFSLNPHKKKNCHHWEPALFLSSKSNARRGHFNNTNYAHNSM